MRPPRISDLVASARGALALARVITDVATNIAVNTGKRIMTKPVGLTETLEALDGGMEVAVRLRRAMGASSPGGKQITVDEMLHGVSDGDLKASIRVLADKVEELVNRLQSGQGVTFAWIAEAIPAVVDAGLDFVSTLATAIKDRRFDPSELLEGVSTEGLRPSLKKAIDGAEKIGGELKAMDFGGTMMLMNQGMKWLPQLLEEPK